MDTSCGYHFLLGALSTLANHSIEVGLVYDAFSFTVVCKLRRYSNDFVSLD